MTNNTLNFQVKLSLTLGPLYTIVTYKLRNLIMLSHLCGNAPAASNN